MGQKVTAVIATHNQLECLRKCLASLFASTIIPEIVVVADRPGEEMLAYLKAQDELYSLTLIVDDKLGLYRHWNMGVRLSNKSYLLICNDDIVLAPYTIENLAKVLDEHKEIWCVCPVQTKGEALPGGFPDNFMPNGDLVSGSIGSCFMVRKMAVEAIGFFSEAYKLWGGDTEFFDMITTAGYPPIIAHSGYIHHFGSKSVKSLGLQRKTSEDRKLYAWRRQYI